MSFWGFSDKVLPMHEDKRDWMEDEDNGATFLGKLLLPLGFFLIVLTGFDNDEPAPPAEPPAQVYHSTPGPGQKAAPANRPE